MHETIEKDHGRIKIRCYALFIDIDWLEQKSEWAGLRVVAMVESVRIIGESTSTECRYYLTSLTDLLKVVDTICAYWTIENSQYWGLM